LIAVQVLSQLRESPSKAENQYFTDVHGRFGVKEIFIQRGGTDALNVYRELIAAANKRIWAVGLTNRRFLFQHSDDVAHALRRSPGIDARIVFADPELSLDWNGGKIGAINAQVHLEQRAPSHADWARTFQEHLDRLRLLPYGPDAGHLRVFIVRSICFSTCFVIDDDVFFFPMLARADSGQDPTIRVGVDSVLGMSLIDHLNTIFDSADYCLCVYDSRAKR
jgi:hypothetical protein